MFVDVAAAVQPSESAWVRPLNTIVSAHLDQKNNPFYQHGRGRAFVALSNGEPVGRILAHISNRQQRLLGQRVGCFGLFETIDDRDVSQALLVAAERYLTSNGCTDMAGPFNITAAQEMGIVVRGFENSPNIDMVQNPAWYDRLLRDCGMKPCLRMKTWRTDDVSDIDPAALMNEHRRAGLTAHGVSVRTMNWRQRHHDMEAIRELVNCAFLGNWGFVPIDRAEWIAQLGPLIPLLDPSLIQIAEVAGVPVGVTFAVPDYNLVLQSTDGRLLHPAMLRLMSRRPLRDAAVILFALRKSYQGLGISRRLNQELICNMQRRGYKGLSCTWIADANKASEAQVAGWGAAPLHNLAMYHRSLGGAL
ncbi:MAG: hypothetical protein H8E66_13550 [Planctomycetes bacterium]|nr:hypothetical protein [Planctomycetota bacterium]